MFIPYKEEEWGNSIHLICTFSKLSSIISSMIMISGHSTYLHPSLGGYLSVSVRHKWTCNCMYPPFIHERGRNTTCTEAALNTKGKDTLEIWGNTFERVLFNNYVLVLEYMCVGTKPNRYSWNHLRNSTFDGPICLQIYFCLCVLTMGRIVFCKWFVNALKHCIYNRELASFNYFILLMASLPLH